MDEAPVRDMSQRGYMTEQITRQLEMGWTTNTVDNILKLLVEAWAGGYIDGRNDEINGYESDERLNPYAKPTDQ